MRRRNRKHRKPIQQDTHRSIASKGNNPDNMMCNRTIIHPYIIHNISEPVPSCQFDLIIEKKSNKKDRKSKKNGKKIRKSNKALTNDWYESNFLMSFPSSKTSSVAFFIPLKDCMYDFNDNDDFKNFMDWNRLFFYESNSSSMISHYNLKRKNDLRDKSMVSEFRKGRSSSESSITSEDSFICFQISDDYNDQIDDSQYSNGSENDVSHSPDIASNENSKKRKKVRFADNSELVTVHVIIAWDFAYRAARVSPWEVVARDANRFKLKIQSLERVISPVLNHEHREKIWSTRMEKFYN